MVELEEMIIDTLLQMHLCVDPDKPHLRWKNSKLV